MIEQSDMNIQLEYKLTLQDYLQAVQANAWQAWLYPIVVLSILLELNDFIPESVNKNTVNTVIISSVILGIICLSIYNPQYNLIGHWIAEQHWNRHPSLGETKKMSISDKGITIQKNNHEESRIWEQYYRIVETKELFLIYFISELETYQIIPKRAFKSEEELNRFRDLLHSKKLN
jgi:hypothetical protein